MRRFLIVWCGQFLSSIGNGLTAFSLGVWAWDKTQTATTFSFIVLCAFLPAYLLKPLGGTLCDRWDRRLLMVFGDLGSGLALLLLLLMLQAGNEELWIVYLGVALSSAFVALQNPAYKASVTDLLDEKAYAKASGLIQLAEASRYLIAPVLAGFLLKYLNITWILAIDVITFVIASFAVLAIRDRLPRRETGGTMNSFWRDLGSGFSYTFSNPKLLWLLLVTSLITFAIGFLQALMGPMILAFTDAGTFGIIQSVGASGMLLGSLFIAACSDSPNQQRILTIALLATGIFYSLLGTCINSIVLTIVALGFFTTLPFVNTALEVLIRTMVDNSYQGRVWAIVSLISQLGMGIAFALAGPLADHLFNPLLAAGGPLADSIGRVIGTGPGRGIGFMFILGGIMIVGIAGYLAQKSVLPVPATLPKERFSQ